MVPPIRRRVNTIGIRYVGGSVKREHYRTIFEDIIRVRDEEIIAIAELDSTHILFKLSTKETYQRICRDFTYVEIDVGAYDIIVIDDISSYDTVVNIRKIPFDITKDEVVQVLAKYGTVKKSYYRSLYGVSYFQGRITDRISINMAIDKPIPSTIYVREVDDYIYLSHIGQIATCHICGRSDHKANKCQDRVGNGINAVSLDNDTDNEPIPEDQVANPGGDEDANDNTPHQVTTADNIQPVKQVDINESQFQRQNISDMNMTSTQLTQTDSQLFGSTCENTSVPESLVPIHKDTHSGEKSFKCYIDHPNKLKLAPLSFTDISTLSGKTIKFSNKGIPNFTICMPELEYNPTLGMIPETNSVTHTGEKPIPCSMGPIPHATNTNNAIKITENVKTIFKCLKCDYTSDHQSEVAKHIQTHTGEKLNQCKQIHTGEKQTQKQLQCELCPLIFHTNEKYEDHTQAHKGKKPFRCTECDHTTKKPGPFLKHLADQVHMKHHVDSGITRNSWSKVVKSKLKSNRKQANKY